MTNGRAQATYGDRAARILRPLEESIRRMSKRFAASLYRTRASATATTDPLIRLTPDELANLQRRQGQHLAAVLAADATQAGLRREAARVGRIHARVGVDLPWLIEAFTLYQDSIHQVVAPSIKNPGRREQFLRLASQRIMAELGAQAAVFRHIEQEASATLARMDERVINAANLRDVISGVMEVLGQLEGEVSAFFARADANGQLQIEASSGAPAGHYHQAMETGAIPRISIDPDQRAGQGPGGRAWRTGHIIVTDAWALESGHAPWQSVGKALGFRASAAVPILDAGGRSIALLSLYSSWPGYFSTMRIRSLLTHAQGVLGAAIQRREHLPVIPWRDQEIHRHLIQDGKVVMLYQPVLDLRSGTLVKVEALARLRGPDEELIVPSRFLPSLGDRDLLRLFELGLQRVCKDRAHFAGLGHPLPIALNLPAGAWGDTAYETTLFGTLAAHGFPTDQLQLEILETHDRHVDDAPPFYRRLREAGIRVAQDDLGSGHSSLLRLNQYLFDEVKIDQALVRDALRKPIRALEFILHISRLAHAFDIPVTVEGLENNAVIEAAALLGADHGQGYGIARPMSADTILSWYKGYRYLPGGQSAPHTALGALAGFLLWDQQLAAIATQPKLAAAFAQADHTADRFVADRCLEDSPLAVLLRRNHEAAAAGAQGAYAHSRAEVIALLAQYSRADDPGQLTHGPWN